MLERELFHQYGIVVNHVYRLSGGYLLQTAEMGECILKRAQTEREEDFPWYVLVSQYFNQQNEPTLLPVPSKKGRYIETIGNEAATLYQLPLKTRTIRESDGHRLALLHRKGGNLLTSYSELPEVQPWQMRWQRRIDQLEAYRVTLMQQEQPLREFDTLFIETFPYYLGLSENAIQYLVDAGIDAGVNPFDVRTLVFKRYNAQYIADTEFLLPSEFILDHPARDLAEWVRYKLFDEQAGFDEVRSFIWDYHQRRSMNAMDWNLLYARILFPIAYVEDIERYYSEENLKEKQDIYHRLQNYVNQEGEREALFKGIFSELIGERGSTMRQIEWLTI